MAEPLKSFELTLPAGVLSQFSDVVHDWCGAWAIEWSVGTTLFDQLQQLDLAEHMAANSGAKAASQAIEQSNSDGIAVIDIQGSLQKARSSLGGTSTVMLRRAVSQAAADSTVKAIMLRINSPGGTVAGNDEAAQAIADAAKVKPVWAYIEDLGASAAYWLGSQANKVMVNRTGRVGSIGTYMAVADHSTRAAQMGVKIHVIRAGAHKGAGTPGTEITAEHLTEWQRQIDQLNQFFVDAVAQGRKVSAETVKTWADGRVHIGQDAVALGLADGVASFEGAMQQLSQAVTKQRGTKTMNAASLSELKAAFPDMSAEWRETQLEAGATLEKARAAHTDELRKQLKKSNDEKAAAEAKAKEAEAKADKAQQDAEAAVAAEKAKTKPTNPNDNVRTGGKPADAEADGGDGTATAQFQALVEAQVTKFGDSVPKGNVRALAVREVTRKHPELHAKMLEEAGCRPVSARSAGLT